MSVGKKLLTKRHFKICLEFELAVTYFAATVSYVRKMFLTLTPGANVIKLFLSVIYEFSY